MPGIAPRVMAWQRRLGGNAGPLSASGEASNENPVQVEILIDGVWIDITSYVMVRDNNGNISVTRGRRDEGSQTDQSSCHLTLNNRDGRWSPRNPSGTYFGKIGRNTPVRVSVPNGYGGKSYRFQGEMTSWPQSWDPTGTDIWTEGEAAGILRRLSQGPPPAGSIIRNSVLAGPLSPLKAYWPCEDPEGSVNIASALTNGSAMEIIGTPTLASYTGFGSSDPLPDLTNGSLSGGVALYSMTSVTEYQLRYLMAIPKGGITDTDTVSRLVFPDGGTIRYMDVIFNDPPGGLGSYGGPGTLTVIVRDGDENELATGGTKSLTLDVRGRQLLVSLEVSNNGANLAITLRVYDVVNGIEDSAAATFVSTNVTRVTRIIMAPSTLSSSVGAADTAFGHITLETDITPITSLGRGLSPAGEAAGRRIERLCAESGISFESLGDLDDTAAMGGQERLNPLSLMQECEDADDGMLYESMPMIGLGYRTRNSLCNQDAQLTLSYSGFNLSEVPIPVEDDRYIQNQVTVTIAGVSATYAETAGTLSTELPPTGVGVYGQDVTLNLEDTGEALSQAAWRVHLGTVDEPRYPQIAVNLAHSSFTSNPALKQAVLGLRQGDRIVVQNPPSWLPPGDIDQIILGFDETITHFEHRITFICAPASPYRVGVVDQSSFILDTDGSVLAAAASSGATALDVKPAEGLSGLWTTDSSNMPLDLRVGGEVVRVSDIGPWLDDTFTRSVSGGWGTADSGQSWSVSGGTVGTDYSTNGTAGVHVLTSVNVSRRSFTDTVYTDFDYYVDVTTSATATGGSLFGGPTGRYIDSSNMYTARLEFTTANAIQLSLRKFVGGTETLLGSYDMPNTHVAGTYIRVRLRAAGVSIMAKSWLATEPEPGTWFISATDSSITTTSFFGTRSIAASGNTNVNPEVRYDNLQVVNPQTFTVTRSINGITKAQVAGEDIRLATPTVISL